MALGVLAGHLQGTKPYLEVDEELFCRIKI